MNKKRALVDFEEINNEFYDTILKTILDCRALSMEQKRELISDLDDSLDNMKIRPYIIVDKDKWNPPTAKN